MTRLCQMVTRPNDLRRSNILISINRNHKRILDKIFHDTGKTYSETIRRLIIKEGRKQ